MKISLLVIGKTAEKSMAALIDNYVRRINFYIPFEIIHLTDAKNTKHERRAAKDMRRCIAVEKT